MTPRILAASSPGEVRVAVALGDTPLDYAIDRPGAPDGVGDLHIGRIRAMVPAMAGAFVALDDEDGFLPDSEGAKGRSEGELLAVRVTRAAQGGKGPRLTARVEPPANRTNQGLIQRGPTALERFATSWPDAPILTDDAALAATLRPRFGPRVEIVPEVFDDTIATALAALESPTIALPNGGRMHIHPTPALTAIDLDIGAATAARQTKAAAQLAANRAALPVLAAQIRLRNLSGAILVDLAGLAIRRRADLAPELATALGADPLRPRLLGFTALGFAEILRPRIHPPMHEKLSGPLAAGLAALRVLAREAAARPEITLTLDAAPNIAAALRADPTALADLARRTGRTLTLRADPALPPAAWRLAP